ncbi:hypothetical protein ARTHRO9AX_210194 [Arthrobacter sp. 9AX]|nr:hypothetical protein ARTHRO9AX_210194 [Arthrobacter sp. 9AX]
MAPFCSHGPMAQRSLWRNDTARAERNRGGLLLVALNLGDRPGFGVVGVFAGFRLGPALAEQVPGLVQSFFDLPETVPVRGLAISGALTEGVFLLHKGLDAGQKIFVVHVYPFRRNNSPSLRLYHQIHAHCA